MKRDSLFASVPILALVVLFVTATSADARSFKSASSRSSSGNGNSSRAIYYSETPSTSYRSFYSPPSVSRTASITILVPANAEIWFDGAKMEKTGQARTFVTPALEPGLEYSYRVRVHWIERGVEVDQTRDVPIASGSETTIRFIASSK